MIIGGIQWTTLLDYPGHVAATVFTAGCGFRCPFCHNPELVLPEQIRAASYPLEDAFFGELERRRGFLDAVVISGGEPTIQADLGDVAARIRHLGMRIKLDTNGSRPDVIERLLDRGAVDYVAMDVKAPWDRYSELTGVDVDTGAIRRTVDLLREAAPQYEFRTTAAPGLDTEDLLRIGVQLDTADEYWLQCFQRPEGKALVDDACLALPVLERRKLEEVWEQLDGRFPRGGVRG